MQNVLLYTQNNRISVKLSHTSYSIFLFYNFYHILSSSFFARTREEKHLKIPFYRFCFDPIGLLHKII